MTEIDCKVIDSVKYHSIQNDSKYQKIDRQRKGKKRIVQKDKTTDQDNVSSC